MDAAQSTHDTERSISCSFCPEKFSSPKAMGEHLLQCGNKTDKCPNCGKFVRRAMFAYHYENGCANLDEIENNPSSNTARSNSSSALPSNNLGRTLTEVHGYDRQHVNNNTSDFVFDSSTHNAYFQRPNSAIRITAVCRHCDCECEIADRDKHVAACLYNPNNVNEKKQTGINEASSHEPDRLLRYDHPTENALIPCEYCKQSIAYSAYQEHETKCTHERYEQMERQMRDNYNGRRIRWTRCRYCGVEREADLTDLHERTCFQPGYSTQINGYTRSNFQPPSLHRYGSFSYHYY